MGARRRSLIIGRFVITSEARDLLLKAEEQIPRCARDDYFFVKIT
jgi:hypothetical protein